MVKKSTTEEKILQHLPDIDFRSREERQFNCLEDFKQWYLDLQKLPYDDITHGQLTMLSTILWHLLPMHEYKALQKGKVSYNLN